jgi:hypothetical protein
MSGTSLPMRDTHDPAPHPERRAATVAYAHQTDARSPLGRDEARDALAARIEARIEGKVRGRIYNLQSSARIIPSSFADGPETTIPSN